MWKVEFHPIFIKNLKKIDQKNRNKILKVISSKIAIDPRENGKSLRADLSGLRSHRCGNYRIIYKIKNNEMVIVALTVGHRKEIYKKI